MAKDKKKKLTSITIADEFGNTQTINPTGKTGGYSYNSKTGVSTPALSAVGNNRTQDNRTVKTTQNNQDNDVKDVRTIKTEVKNFGDTIKNSRVKNDGLSVSNVITDVANLSDAYRNIGKSIPIVGNILNIQDKAKKTAENVATNMGTGALNSIERTADTASDLVFNPIERRYNYAFDLLTKGKKTADENLKDLKQMQQRDIKKSQTEDFQKATGYSDVVDERENNSLVTRDNAGGQFFQMVGGQVPSLVLGQALGGTTPLKELKGLKGKELAKAIAQNSAINFKNQLPGNVMLAGQSYGGGLEDSLNKGNTIGKSRVYGLANVANEVIPEYMFGGMPGLGGTGGIDNIVEPILDKGYKGYAKPVVKGLYKATGEGLEEKFTTYLDALARQGILGEKIDWNEVKQDSNKDFLYGMLMGSFLDAPETIQGIQEVKNTRGNIQNENTNINNDTTISPTNQIREIAEQKNNGEIDAEEANNRIADVQNGTYQQNQNNQAVIQEAKRKFDAINQAEASGVYDSERANQERQALTNTINQMTQPQQNETQEGVVQEQQETKEEPKIEQQKVEEKPKQEKSKSTDSIKEIRQEVEEKTNKTMSKHIETSSKATNTVEDIKNMNYDDIVYDTKTHKKSQEQASRELQGKDIDTNINDIHAKFRGTERLTNVDSAKITELMKQTKALADEAAKNGNDSERNKRMEQFRTLKGDYAVALSESGQFVEYAKVIKELDPETQIDVLKKVIEKEQRRGNKKYEEVKINEELEKRYKEAKTDEERDAIMEEIKDDTARQIKITFADKANEFRFLSMLGNVKTHGRNFIGNVGMYSLQSFKDGVAAIGEDIYNKTSKNGLETRSKTLKPATKEVSNFVNEKVDSFLKDQKSKYNESRGMKGDIEERTKKFSDNNIIGKALNKASNLNSRALDYEDRLFSSLMTKQAMKGFLTANGIETNADIEAHPELVAQALDYALFKGKEATFHQDSTTATAIRNLRDKLYTGSGFSKLGGLAIDTTLPFVSTPANIAKNALEYTPIIGFGDINKQFQNAPNNMKANVLIDSLSKQFTGGALMAVGAYLASQGLVKGSGDDDKEDKTEASLGNASYSIKIGNSTYDLSWLSPTAIPFFEGVEVFNAFKKANSKGGIKATDTADLIDTMFGTLNPMTDMSVLQSIERIITSIAYGGNAVKSATSTTFSSYLQQYIPTLLSQIAQVGDTKQRNTNTGGNVLEKTWDQIQYKIPGRRNTLPEKVDVWGDTNKTADNIPQRMFEAFISPANRKDYKVDNTTKELERLARETDDTAMLPTVKNKKLRVNGEDQDLKGKDYVDLQKTYGKTAKENLDELIESDAYKNADDNEKNSMVGNLYKYASYKAKEKYAKNKGINFDGGTQTSFAMIDAFEIPYEKYVENQVSGKDSASKMLDKLNGAGLSEAQKGAVMNYFDRAYYVNEDELYNTLDNSDLSDKQKELIRTKYENSITDKERERYQRADNIGVDYDLYTNFRSFVNSARGESRTGGPTKKQKVINWIQDQELTAQQKQNLYNDYINNQGIFSYYK